MDAARIRRAARRLGSAALIAALATTTAGCTLGGKHETRSAPARKMNFALGATGDQTTQAVPSTPVATVHTNKPGLDFELYVLRRSGRVVNLVFALHNTTGKTIDLDGPSQDLDGGSVLYRNRYARNVALVDAEHLKAYLTFMDEQRSCTCTKVWENSVQETLAPNKREYGMAQVAAPPTDVSTVTVQAGSLAAVHDARMSG